LPLEPYLTPRRADETSLFSFYHRQLDQVARRRYLAADKGRGHRALAEFFGGQPLYLGEAKRANLRQLSELPFQLSTPATCGTSSTKRSPTSSSSRRSARTWR
jgi:hypothetical protein